MIEAFDKLRSGLAVSVACQALGVPRASIYRARGRRRSIVARASTARPRPPLALNETERKRVRAVLNSERFADMAPPAIYATLLDQGQYLASVRTMYRLLPAEGQSLERDAASGCTPCTGSRSSWRCVPMNSGRGISPSSRVRCITQKHRRFHCNYRQPGVSK